MISNRNSKGFVDIEKFIKKDFFKIMSGMAKCYISNNKKTPAGA
jgi:hypothetical protein